MYFVVKPGPVVVFGSAIAALVVGLVVSLGKTIRPPLILLYGALEGVFVGGISYWYADALRRPDRPAGGARHAGGLRHDARAVPHRA